MSRQYWEEHKAAGQRQVDYSNARIEEDIERHRGYVADFQELVDLELAKGTITPVIGSIAVANFEEYMIGSRNAQASKGFYDRP